MSQLVYLHKKLAKYGKSWGSRGEVVNQLQSKVERVWLSSIETVQAMSPTVTPYLQLCLVFKKYV